MGMSLPHGIIEYPIFLPDATSAVVRAVDSTDLAACGIRAVVMNVFHLMQRPGSSTIYALGGLHSMAGWPYPIITDSGGFQAYSLIRQNPKNGSITKQGISFCPDGSDRKFNLSPEKTVQLQSAYGADVLMCLDDCTHVADSMEVQTESVARTIEWAKRCKAEYERLIKDRENPPKIFAVVQGGGSRELRRQCAKALLDIGFDGYGYGGWPLDENSQLVVDMLATVRESIPEQYPMHALGVGHPYHISECVALGYQIFDSALPTRDARHGRLYVMDGEPSLDRASRDWFSYIYIQDKKHIKSRSPIDPKCTCLTCRNYSQGYLHHLFRVNESSYQRLATIHNLQFMSDLMSALRASLPGGGQKRG